MVKMNTTPDLDKPAHKDGKHCALSVTVDFEEYLHFLDDEEISEADKRELLQTLWNIVCEFVALGFGVHPVQQARNPCGQVPDSSPKSAPTVADEVEWEPDTIIKSFDDVADLKTDPAAGAFET